MRLALTTLALLSCFGLSLGVAAHDAKAGPSPTLSPPAGAQMLVQEAGYWRRYCRFNDCDGPNTPEVNVDVVVPGETPPLVAIVPVRPASCGQYRYWDGDRCVDARYNNPYIGPR
jgi:hypothetical protein